jgi:nitrogen PTS system EIIA component
VRFYRLAHPLHYDAVDGAPVDLVLLVLSPDGKKADAGHLALLAAAARRLRDAAVATRLRQAGAAEVVALLV